MKRVKSPNDVPVGKHYQVIIYNVTSVSHEGDERSRTHPGHGYPAYTEKIDSFEQYVSEDKNDVTLFLAELDEKNSRFHWDKKVYSVVEVEKKLEVKRELNIKF